MAEVVGLVASVATLLHVARKVQEYGQDYFTAQEQQDELVRTLGIFETNVKLLGRHAERAFKNPNDERFEALRTVLNSAVVDVKGKRFGPDPCGRSDGALKRIENGMKELEKSLGALKQKGAESRIKRLWWHHDKKAFLKIITKIAESITQVESVLAYDQFAILLDADDGVRKVMKNQETERDERQVQRKLDAEERQKVREEEAEERQKIRVEQAQAVERLRQDEAEQWKTSRKEAAEETQRVARERDLEAKEKKRLAKEKKRLAIIDWLSPLSFQARQSELHNQCIQPNVSTPSLIESPEFDAWTSGPPWVLRCVGEPGAGKTFLSALVIERLKSIFENRNVPVLCIYLNYKESSIQTLGNLIGSLLKQLLQHPHAEFQSLEAKRLFSGAENESRPTVDAFYQAFKAEIQHFERVMIVVDAYDEASPAVRERLLDQLLGLPREKASLMVTSRPIDEDPDPREVRFCDCCGRGRPTEDIPPLPPLKIYYRCDVCNVDICQDCKTNDVYYDVYCKDRNHILRQPNEVKMNVEPSEDDIKRHVQKELDIELRLGTSKHSGSNSSTKSSFGTTRLGRICRRRPDLHDRIVPSVVSKANSMFTLAGLYIQTLRACMSEGEVEDALDDPPEGYDGFYERNMLRITEESENTRASSLARKILEWVVFAHRPLSLAELRDALAVDLKKIGLRKAARPDKATILEVTAGMVIIDVDEANVRLNHRTAQEYFDKTQDRWFANASANLARISLHYMSLEELAKPCGGLYEDREFDARKKAYPLIEYAYVFWGDHAHEAEPHPEAQAAVFQYVSDPDKIAAWTQAAWYLNSTERAEWDIRKGANSLLVCAWFGLTNVASKLLDEGLDVNAADPNYKQTPLMYACRRGQSATVAKLLEYGADVNQYNQRSSVALFEAVENGNIETVELLLAKQELDINAVHLWRYNRTALMLAAQDGKLQIVNALLDQQSAKADQKDLDGNTSLSLASKAGQTEVVDQLLKRKEINIDSQNCLGATALINAATAEGSRKENEAKILIAKSLLEKDADSSIKDHQGGGTALLRAVDAGNEAMVKLLIKYNADICIQDDLERGLLHSAAIDGHEAIVALLLTKQLNVNAQDKNGKTPLHDASRDGNDNVAKLLLDAGADPSIKDLYERTAWTIAWQYGNLKIMKLLQPNGNFGEDDIASSTVYPNVAALPIWSLASLGFKKEVANMIATRPNDIYFCDPDMGNTALHCAINANNPTILKHLLRAGLSPDSLNDYHRTPLHLAALAGHVRLLTILLSYNAKPDQKDRYMQTPLEIAHHNRYLKCAVILVEAGAHTSPRMRQSLFFAAVELGRLPAVTKLIDMGADLSLKNALGQTALQMAKESGKGEILQVLRSNKSVFRSPGLVEDEDDGAQEELSMLSVKESPFHRPEVWDEEGSGEGGEGTVVAGRVQGSVPVREKSA